jgi:hypothetical protein
MNNNPKRLDQPCVDDADQPTPGSMNDSALVRNVLMRSIKSCPKSRAQIAEEISILAGREVSEISLSKYTAESRTDYRWPAELDRAFCAVTSDDTLLRCRAELAGYQVISAAEAKILEIGRQYLVRKRSAKSIALLERGLSGVDL